jgi:hypothetical protein
MSKCTYCYEDKGKICNCEAFCLKCRKAKLIYETTLKILHYQPESDEQSHAEGSERDASITKKGNCAESAKKTKEKPGDKLQTPKNKKIKQENCDKTGSPKKLHKEDNVNEDKAFYCFRQMQDVDTKCCKQCQKTR